MGRLGQWRFAQGLGIEGLLAAASPQEDKTMLTICLSRALLVLLNAAPGRAQDMAEYCTVQHPEEFDIDWTGFHHAGNERTAALLSGRW